MIAEHFGRECSLTCQEEVGPGHWEKRSYIGRFVSFEKESGHTKAVIRLPNGQIKSGWIYNLKFNIGER